VRNAADSSFLRDFGRVDRLGRVEAIVAIAASCRRILAEMAKQDRSPAAGGLDEDRERIEPIALASTAIRFDLLLDAAAGSREILGSPEEPGFRGLAVAAGAARLLIIGFDRLRDPAWATKRTSGLSMPIPKATVAAMTISSESTNDAWFRARTDGSRPA
jgi:hypothetical protein